MRKICLMIIILGICVVSGVFAGDVYKNTPELARYLRDGAKGKLTLKIVDEDGMPVAGAKIGAHFQMHGRSGIKGTSNTNGLFTMEDKSQWKMHYGVEKDGYYKTVGEYMFGNDGDLVVQDGKWQPWDPEVRVVLRPVVNPIPMYAKRVNATIPLLDQFVGFDLEKADWVAPYGFGNVADLNFQIKKRVATFFDFDSSLDLVVTNAVDGFQETSLTTFQSSAFRLSRQAPLDGYVLTDLHLANASTNFIKYNDDQSYYFRIRSATNEHGHLVSALYGKIRSYIGFGVRSNPTGTIQFTYYLNPTPNDRNLEFDPSRNLFKNLSSLEQVTEP